VVTPGGAVVVTPGGAVVVGPGVVVVGPGVPPPVSSTWHPAIQIAGPFPFQFSPGKPIEATGGMMSPHCPLGELGGSVSGKIGPVCDGWPLFTRLSTETVICWYGLVTAEVRWHRVTEPAG
jgi:hypothetical protein